MTLANILTFSRLALILPFIACFYLPQYYGGPAALFLFMFASFTDYVDGYLARKMNQESELGRFLDPIADKLLVGAALFFLMMKGYLLSAEVLAAYIIIAREIFISGLREFLGPYGIVVNVTFWAKAKTSAQMMALFLLLISYGFADPMYVYQAGTLFLWISAVLALGTAVQYVQAARQQFKELKASE